MPLTFAIDRIGAAVEEASPIEFEIEYEDLGIDADRAPEELAERIHAALGEKVEDEEGIFDFVVSDGERVVAALPRPAIAAPEKAVVVFNFFEELKRLNTPLILESRHLVIWSFGHLVIWSLIDQFGRNDQMTR